MRLRISLRHANDENNAKAELSSASLESCKMSNSDNTAHNWRNNVIHNPKP